jgi:hypothetical protein
MSIRFLYRRQLIPLIYIYLSLILSCSPAPTPTPFIPPTAPVPLIEPTFLINPTQPVVIIESSPLPTIIPTVNPEECSSNLTFISDLTIPDNTSVAYGSVIDKQWIVENSGSCHWSSEYRLKHIGGAALGAPEEIALYPARAGTQANIQILFTAPFTDGEYESAWQAFDPDGVAFGDPIFIRIIAVVP